MVGIKVNIIEERMCHYYREPGHFMRECQKKKRDQAKQGEQKTQMQQMTKVAERNLLNS